jgi:hypothetical protein
MRLKIKRWIAHLLRFGFHLIHGHPS